MSRDQIRSRPRLLDSRSAAAPGLRPVRAIARLQQTDLVDGATITGASAMHAQIKTWAATVSF